MEIIRSIQEMKPLTSSIVTVGNYDGIHLGHQDVLNHIVKIAKKESIPSCLITFDPNPAYVLSKDSKPMNLQDINSKMALLEEIGIDKKVEDLSYDQLLLLRRFLKMEKMEIKRSSRESLRG